MKNKIIFIVCDGLGDRPISELDDKTPLESARTPNLDKMAQQGICGTMLARGDKIYPESHTAHLGLFGYDPKTHAIGRGPFEAAGINMELEPGDICFRANMGTVDDKLIIIDRRAGRIDNTSEYAQLFNKTVINGVTFLLKKATAYRVGLIMRGKGLSANITDGDPHKVGKKALEVKPKDKSKEAAFTAKVLNEFLEKTHEQLKKLPSNKKREKQGKFPANYFLVRGAGVYPKIDSFQEKYGLKAACIAGAGLYKGIGKVLGMKIIEVQGATGKPDTNLNAKIDKTIDLYQDFDFFYVHFKAADSFGEDGNYQGKKDFIEKKIDKAIKPLFNLKDALVVVTADHSSPCVLKDHSTDPVPLLIWGKQIKADKVEHFGEKECSQGSLGNIKGIDLMPKLIKILKET